MPKSTATIKGHPIHPMLIVFPIALWVAAFVCDIAYALGASEDFAEAALWLLGGGLLAAVAAAVTGLADFLGSREVRDIRDAWRHMIGNVIATVIALLSFIWRLEAPSPAEAVVPWGLLSTAVIVVLLLYTGWKGGELVYRHHVGTDDLGVDEAAGRLRVKGAGRSR